MYLCMHNVDVGRDLYVCVTCNVSVRFNDFARPFEIDMDLLERPI
jgi:hypothetical protein